MKKIILLSMSTLMTLFMSAQTYTIVSRSNDTIKMYRNALGEGSSSLKSMIPGSKAESAQYRLIKKVHQGKESLIFVDFTKVLDKILVAYETDMITPGEWQTIAISYADLYNAVTRRNAVYLSGEILGMKIEMFQRPPVIWEDIVNIDGVEFPLPIKLATYESDLAKKAQKEAEKELQKKEEEAKRMEKDKKDGFDENYIKQLAAQEENKAYIAYLIKNQDFDGSYSEELRKYFVSDEINQLLQNHTAEQLAEMARMHNKYFDKYSKR